MVLRSIARLAGLPHPHIMPWRSRIPLLREIDPERGRVARLEGEPGCALQLLGKLAADPIDAVDLATLERRQSRRTVGDALEHQAFDARRLAPILLESLHHQFDAGRERDEFVRSGADRRLLEAVVADFLEVF